MVCGVSGDACVDCKEKTKGKPTPSSCSLTDKGLFYCSVSSAILFLSHARSGPSEFSCVILATVSSMRTPSLNTKKTSACHLSFFFTFLFSICFSRADYLGAWQGLTSVECPTRWVLQNLPQIETHGEAISLYLTMRKSRLRKLKSHVVDHR